MRSPLEQFDIINVKSINIFNVDVSLNNIFFTLIGLFICYYIYVYVYLNRSHFIYSYSHYIIEKLYIFIYNLIKDQAGFYGLFWFPLIFSIFTFILFCNLFSLIPFGVALTSHFIIIFWMSCTLCTSVFIIGLLRHNLKFLQIFIPMCPLIILPLLIPIEIFLI